MLLACFCTMAQAQVKAGDVISGTVSDESEPLMMVHVVEKKIPHIDADGNQVSPESPNGYKFELLVLDMVHMMDSNLAFEVDRVREFAPIKNLHGVDSVDSARELLEKNGVTL